MAYLPVDNEDQVLLSRVLDLISHLQIRIQTKKQGQNAKANMEETKNNDSQTAEDVVVDLDMRVYRENIASASLRMTF